MSPSESNDKKDGSVISTEVETINDESNNAVVESSPSQNKTPPPQPPQMQTPTVDLFMRAMNTSPRRIFLSTLSTTSIALGANFFGVTSNILQSLPEEFVESTSLDRYYPRGDFKRYYNGENGYTFVIPKYWVADTALELAKATQRAGTLDYSMRKGGNSQGNGSIPDAAFGPPGKFNSKGVSSSDTNVSIIVSKVRPTFTLQSTLGPPKEAAEYLLSKVMAPPSSGRVGTLLEACEEVLDNQNGKTQPIYKFEYSVDRGDKGVPLRAISIITATQGMNERLLYTMTVVAPASEWQGEYAGKLNKIISSFKVTR